MTFLKKNWYYLIPAMFLLSPVFILLYISASYGYTLPQSISVMKHLGEENTKFQTPTYRENKFTRIVPGMGVKQVFEMVGMPLERHDNDTRWIYSTPVGGAPYFHERTLLMSGGKVTKVINRFHMPGVE
jgi:hypothetical protein